MEAMTDIQLVPEVSLYSMMGAVLPSIPPDELDQVYKTLISAGHIDGVDKNSPRWSCLPLDSDAGAFKILEVVVKAIQESHLLEPDSNIKIKTTEQTTPLGDRGNTSRSGGFFHLVKDTENTREDTKTSTEEGAGGAKGGDIIMPMEFSNTYNRQSRVNDTAKVTWSMHHIMRNDPRRRHVLGLTCEGTKARLWYNDRADVVVSREFDVNKYWQCVVRIIVSVQVSPLDELGYDPTIIAVDSNDQDSEPSYDISIHNPDTRTTNVYRTIGIISDVEAKSSIDYGTRVWKVKKLINGRPDGPTYALKDMWIREDQLAEHVILREIREKHPERAQFFLTPIDHGFVPLDPTEPDILDSTHNTLGRPRKLKPTRFSLDTTIGQLIHMTSAESRSALNSDLQPGCHDGHLSQHPRQHYRVVFKEVGKPVHNLRNFADIFTAIQGGWKGLHALHLSSYVHRGVNSWNILLVPASDGFGERGVIMDLEYAKQVNDVGASHAPNMGTAAFMATEVEVVRHHRLDWSRGAAKKACSSKSPRIAIKGSKNHRERQPPPPFRHNPLHDMESVWWLCIWMMFLLVPSDLSSWRTRLQVNNYHSIFGGPTDKRDFFCHDGVFEHLTEHFPSTPQFAGPMREWLDSMNAFYRISYGDHETAKTHLGYIRIDEKVIKDAYDSGLKALAELKKVAKSLPDWVTLSKRYANPATMDTPPNSPRFVFDGICPPPAKKHRTK